MEVIKRRSLLCLCLLLLPGSTIVETATVKATTKVDRAGSGSVIVRCEFTVSTGEQFRILNLWRGNNSIAYITSTSLTPTWYPDVPRSFIRRVVLLSGSVRAGVLNMRLNSCGDGQIYACSQVIMYEDSRQFSEISAKKEVGNCEVNDEMMQTDMTVIITASSVAAGISILVLIAMMVYIVVDLSIRKKRMKRRRRRHRARNQLAPEHPQGRSHDHAARSSQSVLTAVGGGGEAIPRSDSAIHSSFSSTLEGDYEMLPSTSGMQGTSGNNTVQGTSKSRIKQRAGRKRTGSSQSVLTTVAGGGEAIPLSTFSSTLEGDYEILPSADGTSGMQGTSDNNTVQGTSDSRRRQRAGRKRTGKVIPGSKARQKTPGLNTKPKRTKTEDKGVQTTSFENSRAAETSDYEMAQFFSRNDERREMPAGDEMNNYVASAAPSADSSVQDRQSIYDELRYDQEDAGTYTELNISSGYESLQSPNAQPVSNPEAGENAYDTLV